MTKQKRTTATGLKCKAYIKKYSKDFDGELTDIEVRKLIGVSKVTYTKYKRELRQKIYGE